MGRQAFCYHSGLDEFAEEIEDKFDLIISNPPFYTEGISSGNEARDKARQTQSLPFNELLDGVSKLLSKNGIFATIIPYKEERCFLQLAESLNLFQNELLG